MLPLRVDGDALHAAVAPLSRPGEQWKRVDGSDLCAVSDQGRAFDCWTARILWQYVDDDGHCQVRIRSEGKRRYLRLDRLVALAFVPNPYGHEAVRHLGADLAANAASELAWGTPIDVENDVTRNHWMERIEHIVDLGSDAATLLEPWERLRTITLDRDLYRPSLSDPWPVRTR